VVAVVAGDSVASLSSEEFLKKADGSVQNNLRPLPSPVIPNGYNRVSEWQVKNHGVTREQLAMVSSLMSRQAVKHPLALTKKEYPL